MKRVYVITFAGLLFLYSSCTSTPNKDNKNEESTANSISINQYRNELDAFPLDSPASSLKALELFKHQADKSNADCIGLALKTFLDFQDRLADSINKRLVSDTAFSSRVNSLVYLDSSLYETEDLEFEKQMLSYGFRFRRAEGSIYAVSNPDLIKKYFYDYLSEAGKAFLLQYAEEVYQPFAADAALLISVEGLGKRTVFWEKFAEAYPKSPFENYSRKQFRQYLYFLLAGMDNTPAFAGEKLSNDFFDAYERLIREFPDSKTAGILKDYMKLLSENDYSRSSEVFQFLKKYSY